MKKNNLMEVLTAYKVSALFFVAYKIGIFESISKKAKDTSQLISELGVEKMVLIPILRLLSEMSLINKHEDKWLLNKAYNLEGYKAIIQHEMSIYARFNTLEMIKLCIQQGIGNRPFDKEGFTFEEEKIYFNAMNGQNLKLIALLIAREIPNSIPVNYLEYGRSIGAIGVLLQERIKHIHEDIVMDKQLLHIYREQIEKKFSKIKPQVYSAQEFNFNRKYDVKNYDVIMLYNTIHYLTPTEAVTLLKKMKAKMAKHSVLCIADIFITSEELVNDLVLLDWITHGGMNYLYLDEVKQLLNTVHLKVYKQLKSINVELLFIEVDEDYENE